MPAMPATEPARKLTYEDLCRIPEDGQRHEILDGVEVVTPSPRVRHQEVVLRLARILADWVEEARAGKVLVAPLDVVLSEHDVLEPDLLFVAKDRLGILTEANVQGAPDLVVEVLSPSTHRRDLVEKRERYGLFGVREYWVVDPDACRVEVFRLEGTVLEKAEELWAGRDQRLTSPLFAGLDAPVDRVFRS